MAAYCAGYLNGLFKDLHAHVVLPCHEAEEDTPADHEQNAADTHEPLEATSRCC